MSKHDELLEKFENFARTAESAKSLMQHISESLHTEMARYNWVGFYLMEFSPAKVLVLGPYVGSFVPAQRIPLEKGLCGACATSGKTVAVNNVGDDPRYLGTDSVKSNIVVPIILKNQVVAELDVESYFADAFLAAEQKFIESCAALVGRRMEKEVSGARAKQF
jgi:putative methionine-R-sulfoxide reductase with GAF domain